MKCPKCALYHPDNHLDCVACGATLERDGDDAAPKRKIFGISFGGGAKKAAAQSATTAPAEAPRKPVSQKTTRKADPVGKLDREKTTKLNARELDSVDVESALAEKNAQQLSTVAAELEAETAETQRRLEAKQRESDALQAQKSQTEEQLEGNRRETEVISARKAETQQQLEAAREEAFALEAKRSEAQRQLERAQKEFAEFEAKNAEAQKALDERRLELARLAESQFEAAELEAHRGKVEELERLKSETQSQLEAKRRDAQVLDANRIAAQEQLEQKQKEADSLEAKRSEMQERLEASWQEAERLETLKRETQEQLEQRRAETAQLEEQKQQAQRELEAAMAEVQAINAQRAEAEIILEQRRNESKQLEAEHLIAREELEKQRAAAQQLEANRVAIERQLELDKKAVEQHIESERQRAESEKKQAQEILEAQRAAAEAEAQKRLEAQQAAAAEAQKQFEAQQAEAQRILEAHRAEAQKIEAQKLQAQKMLEVQLRESQRLQEQKELVARTLQEQQSRVDSAWQQAAKIESQRIQQSKMNGVEIDGAYDQRVEAFDRNTREMQAQQLQQQLHAEVTRRAAIEKERGFVGSQKESEFLQPVGAGVGSVMMSADQSRGTFDSPDAHKKRKSREPFGSAHDANASNSSEQRGYDVDELRALQRNTRGGGTPPPDEEIDDYEGGDDEDQTVLGDRPAKGTRRSKGLKPAGFPILGAIVFVVVLLVFAGATIFFLTKPPDDERLYTQGVDQLKKGQYAFAVKSLTDASALRPKDPRVFLALARAYVGIDQVDKAWESVSQAQALGAGVTEEPALASDLAKYYRQRGEYEKAINLLRPLAKAEADGKTELRGKKAELADLDANWGDELIREGKLDAAQRCWEEVRDLNEGSRASEAQARLATIYQKMANNFASDGDSKNDADALKYLHKLNNIAENPRNLEMAAELYTKSGDLELAIEELRRAEKLGRNPVIQRKLAALLSKRGKELMDQGNTDAGYAYLQQAKSVSPSENTLPAVALRDVNVGSESGLPRISGRVWNPTERSINALTVKVEVFDVANSKVLWQKDQQVIDQFVPPLGTQESKPFDFTSGVTVKPGTAEFRVYLDGSLYKSYLIGKKERESNVADDKKPAAETSEPRTVLIPPKPVETPAPRPQPVAQPTPPVPGLTPTPTAEPTRSTGPTAEERTMKDLDQ